MGAAQNQTSPKHILRVLGSDINTKHKKWKLQSGIYWTLTLTFAVQLHQLSMGTTPNNVRYEGKSKGRSIVIRGPTTLR